MTTKTVKCVSRKVLACGIVSSTFVFENAVSEFKSFQFNRIKSFNFILNTVNEELDVSWSVKAGWHDGNLEWKKIKLVRYNKNIYGNFVIESHYEDSEFAAGSFDTKSLPFEQSFEVFDDWLINMTMFIYYRESGTVMCSVVDDYDKFLRNLDLSDVTFVVGTKEIPAHKQIIAARNVVLTKMFNSEIHEQTNSRIEITDIETKIFKLLLRFIYSGKFKESKDSKKLQKVMAAAKKYSVNDLVEICEQRLAYNS